MIARGLAAALLVVIAARAEPVHAGTCGGGSGGGGGGGGSSGGGGGSSGGSSSSSSSGSSSSAPACHDSTDIVGYRECTGYGRWGANLGIPLLIFEVGMNVQAFASPLGERDGRVEHGEQEFSYRVVDPGGASAPAKATAVMTTLRVGAGGRGIYGAAEVELGGLVSDSSRAEMITRGEVGAPTIEQTSTLAFGALGVLGAQGSTRRATFGVELVGGVRGVIYHYESRYLACQQTESIATSRPVLEARARASIWLSPVINAGVVVGSSVIDRGAFMGGVFLGANTRAFAGLR